MKTKDILVSIIGLDEPGIVAATAETLTRLGCNIEQMTQTTLRDQFTAVYLVNKPEDIENKNIRLEIQTAYDAKKFHLTVSIRDVETAEGKAAAGEPFIVSIWGHDRNDIIATFARIFAEQRINVEGLKAFRIEDDQQVDTRSLHRIMGERAKRMGLRLSMQHAAIFEAIHRVRVV